MSLPMRFVGCSLAVLFVSLATASWAAPPDGSKNRKSPAHAPLKLTGKPAAGSPETAGRLLRSVEQQRRLIAAQVRAEVEHELHDARTLARRDPASAQSSLKLMLDRVDHVAELSVQVRSELRTDLEQALRAVTRQAATKDIADAQVAAQRAAAADRLHSAAALARDQQRLEQLMDRFESLMDEGRYAAADALGEREIAELAPDAPAATSARLVAHQYGAHALNVALRGARQKGVVATLASVETSHMPFSDDQPMVYPRAEVWRERTLRRAKYARTDLRNVSPSEARIRSELDRPTTMEFIETPLNQAVAYLKDLHGIEIQLDTKALEQSGIFSDSPVTSEMKGISLRSALRLLLRPLDLTYVVKDEVLLVTTLEEASQETITKVYPVEDLIVPIRPISVGGAGGGIGNTGMSSGIGTGQSQGGSGLNMPGMNNQQFNGNGPGIGQF